MWYIYVHERCCIDLYAVGDCVRVCNSELVNQIITYNIPYSMHNYVDMRAEGHNSNPGADPTTASKLDRRSLTDTSSVHLWPNGIIPYIFDFTHLDGCKSAVAIIINTHFR